MRRSKRPHHPLRRVERAGQAGDRSRGQGVGVLHRRQQARQTLGQHRLASARRADQQQAVVARGGNFERAFRARLTAHVAQVQAGRWRRRRAGPGHGERLRSISGLQGRHHVEQVLCRAHVHPPGQRGLAGARCGQHQRARGAFAAHGQCQRQGASDRAQLTGQAQLACELEALQRLQVHLARGGQDAQGNGQVETAGLLGQLGGREVDRDSLVVWKAQAAVGQG